MRRNRELITALLLAFLSLTVVLWQAGRVLPLFDYSYQVENAYRMAVGQVPYRDFILIAAPLMYSLLALFMRLTAFTAWGPLLYMMFISMSVVLLTHRVLVMLEIDPKMRLVLLVPLVIAAHGIVPLPSYDVTATVCVLLSLISLIAAVGKKEPGKRAGFIAGALLVLPALAKQNVGVAYLIAAYAGLAVLIFAGAVNRKTILRVASGSALLVLAVFLIFAKTHALLSFIRQNRFVLENRDPVAYGLAILFDMVYWKNLLVYLPLLAVYPLVRLVRGKAKTVIATAAVVLSFAGIPSLFFYGILQQPIFSSQAVKVQVAVRYFFSVWYALLIASAMLLLKNAPRMKRLKHHEKLRLFAVFVLAAAIAAAFLAQGPGGSTFGIYPFFIILLGVFYEQCRSVLSGISWRVVYGTVILLTTVFLTLFTYFNIRQSYVPVAGRPTAFRTPSLSPLGTPGPWTHEIDTMLVFVRNTIPENESVVALPGEDPFYFATRRKPQLRFFELFSGALPYAPERIAGEIAGSNIDWLIVKTRLQSSYYMDTRPVLNNLKPCYSLYGRIPGYSVYHRFRPCDSLQK